MTARITVDSVSDSRVAFKTECLSNSGTVLVDGVAVALISTKQLWTAFELSELFTKL